MKKSDLQSVTFKKFYTIIKKEFQSRKRLEKIFDPSPYFCYRLLKDWFGLRSKPVQAFRDQWHYYILTPHLALDVYDWKRDSVSVGVYDRNQTPDIEVEAEAKDFVALLQGESNRIRSRVKPVRPRAFSFRLLNPFYVLFTNAEDLYQRTLSEDKDKNQTELDDLTGKDQDIFQAALFLYVASFEALLNLIYEIYLEPHLRHGEFNRHIRRAPILTRLQLAPTYCSCFKVDNFSSETDQFKNIQAVFEARNRYIHSNITEPMKTPLIEEDGFQFEVPDHQYDAFNLPLSPYGLRASHLDFVRGSILDMADLIISSMKPRHRKPFADGLQSLYLFLDAKDGGYELSLPVSG